MTDVKIKRSHDVSTPRNHTFPLKATSSIGDPDLLAECSGYIRLRHYLCQYVLALSSHDHGFKPTNISNRHLFTIKLTKYKKYSLSHK